MDSSSCELRYYKNDFARQCPNINGGGHKIQPSRKMLEDFRGGRFHLWRRPQLNVLQNAFIETDILFRGWLRLPVSQNQFMNAVKIARLVSIYRGCRKITIF
jgi:hypothetical protein